MRAKTIEHPIITAMQKRHFLLLDLGPFIGSVCAVAILCRTGLSLGNWVSFVVLWFLGVVGIELGYHRYFSHDSFSTTKPVRAVLAILGSMGGQGPVVTWASTHRYHHNHSDAPEDTHSPYHWNGRPGPSLRGFLHAQLTWKWSYPYPNPSLYTPNLVSDPLIVTLSRLYYAWVILGIVLPGVISAAIDGSVRSLGTGMLFGGVLRLFLGQQMTFLINSLCHLSGFRPFETKDQSRNVAWLVPLTLGGSLHNSHHAFPSSANSALLPGQWDPGFWCIRLAERLAIVRDVRTIDSAAIAARRRLGTRLAPRSRTMRDEPGPYVRDGS
jgi:stearoyl-CoA desaturase (delta-9 desaturase)